MRTKFVCLWILIAGFFSNVQSQEVFREGIKIIPNTRSHLSLSIIPETGGRTDLTNASVNNTLYLDLNLLAPTDSGSAVLRLFRRTNSTGSKRLELFKGDGTPIITTRLSADNGDSFLNRYGGNVGIGTGNPLTKFFVNGAIGLSGSNRKISFFANNQETSSFYQHSNGKVFFVNKSGKPYEFWIGLPMPATQRNPFTIHQSKVEVNTPLHIQNQENAAIHFKAGSKRGQIGWQDSNDQGFYVHTGEQYAMSVNNEGLTVSNKENAAIHFKAGEKEGHIGWQDDDDQGFFVHTGEEYAMSVNTNGGVVIGQTIAPTGYRLAVNGKVICEELRVRLSQNWPDYVFEEDYELMPLEELEKHLKEEKHLPGIPKAAKIEEDGIAVGEMQKLMMEKIEELMLYTLQQQQEIEELKRQREDK